MNLLLDTHTFIWFLEGSDRMIIAQSLVEDMPIITADGCFKLYTQNTIW